MAVKPANVQDLRGLLRGSALQGREGTSDVHGRASRVDSSVLLFDLLPRRALVLQEPRHEDGLHDVVGPCELDECRDVDVLGPHRALLPEEVSAEEVHGEELPEAEVADRHFVAGLRSPIQHLAEALGLHHQELRRLHERGVHDRARGHFYDPADDQGTEGVADEVGRRVAVRRQHVLQLRDDLARARDTLPGRHGQTRELRHVEIAAVAPGQPVDEQVVRQQADTETVDKHHGRLRAAIDVHIRCHVSSRLALPIGQPAHTLAVEAHLPHHLQREQRDEHGCADIHQKRSVNNRQRVCEGPVAIDLLVVPAGHALDACILQHHIHQIPELLTLAPSGVQLLGRGASEPVVRDPLLDVATAQPVADILALTPAGAPEK
mmetsp:Transcript_91311/g.238106  ORF Transcript_91311/g.238106 Transcript_91311/m.238106 type:complete len:378 (+) Transcript_91311:224-1357(+)